MNWSLIFPLLLDGRKDRSLTGEALEGSTCQLTEADPRLSRKTKKATGAGSA